MACSIRLLGSAEFQLRSLWKEKHMVLPALRLKPSKKAGKHDSVSAAIVRAPTFKYF